MSYARAWFCFAVRGRLRGLSAALAAVERPAPTAAGAPKIEPQRSADQPQCFRNRVSIKRTLMRRSAAFDVVKNREPRRFALPTCVTYIRLGAARSTFAADHRGRCLRQVRLSIDVLKHRAHESPPPIGRRDDPVDSVAGKPPT